VLKNRIELVRDGEPQALLTWHKPGGDGATTPIAMEFSDTLEAETRQRIADICERPINLREGGKASKAFPGSSKHFLALPRILARLGFRARLF